MKDDIKNLKYLSDRRFLKKSDTINNTNDTNDTNKNKNNSHYVIKNYIYNKNNKNNIIIFIIYFMYIINLNTYFINH